jgi:hypothetical protein
VFAAEENGAASRVVEIIDPLHTTNGTISGTTISDANAANIAVRSALGALSFEGFGAMPNGVIYYGDEKRPGTGGVGGLGRLPLQVHSQDPVGRGLTRQSLTWLNRRSSMAGVYSASVRPQRRLVQ